MKNCILLVGLVVSAFGCNVARRLPAGEKLYDGADIRIQADSTVSKQESENLNSQLAELSRPRPNAKLFGFPYKVWIYYVVGEPRKENGFRASFRRRFGEEPVLASARALTANETIMEAQLENEGYFRSQVQGRYEDEGYKAKAIYTVQVRPRYYIDSVAFLADSSSLRRTLLRTLPESLLKKGDPYRFTVIKTELDRINDALKRQGYFYFQSDYLTVLADSAVGTNRVRLYLAVKPETPQAARVPYYIRNVYIYPNYTLAGSVINEAVNDTNRARAYTPQVQSELEPSMNRFRIVDSTRLYKPELFNDVMGLRPGRRYNSRAQDLTLSRFINLGVFKFVRNRFEPAAQGDSAVLDVHYYLTPYPKKSVRTEIAGTSKSNNLVGSQLTVGWRNRNTFRRAELLTVDLVGGIEFQIGNRTQSVTNFRYGLTSTLSMPRLLTPFFRFPYDRRQILPKTNITAGFEYIVRQGLYNLQSVNTAFGYAFRTNARTEHTFQPFNVIFARSSNFGPLFYEGLANPLTAGQFLRLLEDQFILSTVYSYNFNSSPFGSGDTYRFMFNVEGAGNAAGLLFPRLNAEGYKTIFGRIFQQYGRADLDFRYYKRLSAGSTLANRFFAGVGVPYGNSSALPFIKQYFVGGSNSLRGFRPRALGPGAFFRGFNGDVPFFQDGGGDVKLEANTELRTKLNRYLQGALFVDAGNVWMFRDSTIYQGASTVFRGNQFLSEVAASAGVGGRIDLSYFVFRLDLAIPIRKPWLPEGQRWVFDEIDLGSRSWRRQNLILNIAVGYPF